MRILQCAATGLFLFSTLLTQAALVQWYPLDEGALDPTTNHIYSATSTSVGTLSGTVLPTWLTTGLPPVPTPGTKAALYFNGSGVSPYRPSLVTDCTGIAGTSARTIAAWLKLDASQSSTAPAILHWGPGTISGGRITFRLNANSAGAGGWQIRLEVQGGGVNGTKNVADGQWHHVAAVIPSGSTVGNIQLYVDGARDTIASSSSGLTLALNTVTNATYPLVIGNTGNGTIGWDNSRYLNGAVDDVRIYDQALTAVDILTLVYGSGNAPTFSAPLADQSIVLGDATASATFAVAAGGTPPLTFQWKFYGTNLPAQTNATLVLNPASSANVGPYSLTISNLYGTTNVSANLRLNTAPIDPPQQVTLVGGTGRLGVTMPATASGYTYQWRKDGTNLPAATDASYTLPGAALSDDSTNYTVVVTLGGLSATSAPPATVHVFPAPAASYAALVLGDSPAGYWRLGETNGAPLAVDETTFNPGAYSNYLAGELGQPGALTNDANTASSFGADHNFVQIPYTPQLSRTDALTLELWVNPQGNATKQSLVNCVGNLPVVGYDLYLSAAGHCVFATSQNTSPGVENWDELDGGPVPPGLWTHLVAVLDHGIKRLYLNGVLAGTQTANYFSATGVPIRLAVGTSGTANFFSGTIDEPAIYGHALTAAQIQNHYLAGIIPAGIAPWVVTQPQPQNAVLGDTNALAFSVSAAGSPPLRYQWLHNGVPLAGATDATLTVPAAGLSGPATYAVLVTNNVDVILSSNASLSYVTAPVNPATQAVMSGAPATFSVSMPAYQSYSYQWQFAGHDLPGATQPALTLPQAGAADSGAYTVVVTLGSDSVPSAPATLSVLPPPGDTYTNVVAADAPLAWWRLNDAPGSSYAAEVSGSYPGVVYPDVRLGQEGALLGDVDTAATFTGYSSGNRTGQSRIDVNYSPDLNPSVFSIECWAMVAGGSGTYRSPLTARENVPGYTAGYLFYAGDNDHWQFWLGTGSDVFFTINGPPVVKNQWAHLVGTYDGANASFYVNGALVFSGPAPYVPNAQNRLCIGGGATETWTGGLYFPGRIDEVALYTHVLNLNQVQAHYAAAFPGDAAPRFLAQPLSRATLAGQGSTLSAAVHSSPPVRFQWQFNGTNLPGATNATLTLNPVTPAQTGTYQLLALHGATNTPSAPATLQVLNGEAVSISFEGYENARTIGANGGVAGLLALTNWNEIGYNTSTGSAASLINELGHTNGLALSWSAVTTRRWNGPFTAAPGDAALLNGFLEASGSGSIVMNLANIPLSYQAAGYSLYAYFGGPSATAGAITPTDTYGAVSLGGVTNYYHSLDLALWDGLFQPAVTTDPSNASPAAANCVVFTNLNSASLTLVVSPHPLLGGPVSLSGLQLVANALTPAVLAISTDHGTPVLTWPAPWILQQRTVLNGAPGAWTDVPNAVSPYTIATPLAGGQFFRLRSP